MLTMIPYRSRRAADQFLGGTGPAQQVVLVVDPDTDEIDVYGPHDE